MGDGYIGEDQIYNSRIFKTINAPWKVRAGNETLKQFTEQLHRFNFCQKLQWATNHIITVVNIKKICKITINALKTTKNEALKFSRDFRQRLTIVEYYNWKRITQ